MKHEVKQLARFHPQQGIWQADEPLFYNGVELADEDATLLEYNIAGSRVSNGKWCLPWGSWNIGTSGAPNPNI